ncbi:sce7726 family protein [Brevibacillus massiliensis]|uniref:sce7726 family protein n=1 Tax=Brevibacillus massiliensis TaxID=1118054 RepID=UPI0009D98E13|nr:sce7726 family protein [Brevibacillus massiliensis]
MEKLRDSDVREVLLGKLQTKHSKEPDTLIINEMGVCLGQSRVDIAVVNGLIHGYEIKSESDTLSRLSSQMNDYNKVFDKVTIVTAHDYLDKVNKMVPDWWGIIVVTNIKGQARMKYTKRGRKNPSQDPYSLVQLLWKDEALAVLKEKGLHKGVLSKPKNVLYERLATNIPMGELKQLVYRALKSREGWRVR